MNAPAPFILHSLEEGDIPLPGRASPLCETCSRLISLDYDGTLCPKNSSAADIDPPVFSLLRQLRDEGVRWGINTGRCLADIGKVLVHFPLMPDFICTCERYVYLADAEGKLSPLTAHNARCHEANMKLRATILPPWNDTLHRLRTTHPAAVWSLSATDPLSIEAQDSETMDLLMPPILALADTLPGVTVQRAGKYLRLADARFDKGVALRAVQEAWNVPEQGLFIMGDGHNDLDTFRLFPLAFCAVPASAHADVLRWISHNHGFVFPDVPAALYAWSETRI